MSIFSWFLKIMWHWRNGAENTALITAITIRTSYLTVSCKDTCRPVCTALGWSGVCPGKWRSWSGRVSVGPPAAGDAGLSVASSERSSDPTHRHTQSSARLVSCNRSESSARPWYLLGIPDQFCRWPSPSRWGRCRFSSSPLHPLSCGSLLLWRGKHTPQKCSFFT